MDRRRFLLTSLAGVLAAPLAVGAQPAGKIPTIGLVQPVAGHPGAEAFRAGLRELGYLDGRNIRIDARVATKPPELASVFSELAGLDIDVIVTWGTPQALAAKAATPTIPIVMMTGDPVQTGLIGSLARPGGNVTGLAILTEEVDPKALTLLREAVPTVSRIGVLFIPANPVWSATFKRLNGLSRMWGTTIVPLEVHDATELDRAFTTAARQAAGALLVLREAVFTIHRTRVVALAEQHRLPTMYGLREFVESGGLMSYGPNIRDTLRRAAYFVDKILKGMKPADLPVEQPTKFELAINLKTAKALGLTIPPSLLARADQVIE
jgi:putative ABC transport system substrate-binding protein